MIGPLSRRLPRSAVAWFGGAALAAAGAVLAVRAHVATLEATRPDVGPPTPVVVAAADLTRGSTLVADSFRVVNVPSTLAPPGSLTSLEQVDGRVLVADIAEGEALMAGGLAGIVPPQPFTIAWHLLHHWLTQRR